MTLGGHRHQYMAGCKVGAMLRKEQSACLELGVHALACQVVCDCAQVGMLRDNCQVL